MGSGLPASAMLRGRDVLLAIFTIITLAIMMAVAIVYIDYAVLGNRSPVFLSEGAFIAVLLAQNAAILVGLGLVLSIWRKLPLSVLGLRPAPRNWLWAAFVIGAAVFPLSFGVEGLLERIFDVSFEHLALKIYAPFGFTWFSAIGIGTAGGLIAPVCEELLFRGLIYGWLRHHFGMGVSMCLSSALFAIVHIQVPVMPEIFVIGLLLCWFYEKSGSLYPAILLHMSVNTASLIWLYAMLA